MVSTFTTSRQPSSDPSDSARNCGESRKTGSMTVAASAIRSRERRRGVVTRTHDTRVANFSAGGGTIRSVGAGTRKIPVRAFSGLLIAAAGFAQAGRISRARRRRTTRAGLDRPRRPGRWSGLGVRRDGAGPLARRRAELPAAGHGRPVRSGEVPPLAGSAAADRPCAPRPANRSRGTERDRDPPVGRRGIHHPRRNRRSPGGAPPRPGGVADAGGRGRRDRPAGAELLRRIRRSARRFPVGARGRRAGIPGFRSGSGPVARSRGSRGRPATGQSPIRTTGASLSLPLRQ